MTSTPGIIRVVVTTDTNVGVSTLITSTKVNVSHSHCLLSLTYFVIRALSAKPKVTSARHWKFYHPCLFVSIPIPLSPSNGAFGGLSPPIGRPNLGLASGPHALSSNRYPQFLCCGRKCKSWICCRDKSNKSRH